METEETNPKQEQAPEELRAEQAEPDLRPAKKTFSRIGMVLFVIAAVTAALQAACAGALYALQLVPAQFRDDWGLWLTSVVPLYCVAVPVGLLMFRKIPAEAPESRKLAPGAFFRLLLICFPLMYAGNLLGTALSLLLSGGKAQNALYSFIETTGPVKIIVIVFLAPLIEEYVFRRQLLDRARRFGEKPAIVLSALAFGLFHMNLYQFFYAFALGLVFAYVYTRTGRLRYSVFMHMFINFLGSVVAPYLAGGIDLSSLRTAGADPAGLLEQFSGRLPQLMALGAYSFAILGLSVAGLVVLIVYAKKAVFLPAAEELPGNKRFSVIYLNTGMILYIAICLAATVYGLAAA